MDKRQFIEQMINEVRDLSVVSVLSTRMDLIQRGMYAKGLCPFHNDRTIGSFVATDAKRIWKCFSCGVGGDNIKFVSLYDGINYLEAAFKIALEFGIISYSEYEEYFERRRYTSEQIRNIERRYEELDKKKLENNIAEDYILDKVFRLFISECSLSEEHKNHLLYERKLSEQEIKEGLYFTFPTRRILKPFAERLRERFKSGEEILAKIPGFYYDRKEQRFTFVKHKGIGIGIKNAKGQVVGIQIRHDKKDESKSRYVWFSSSFANFDEDKYAYGTSSGSPVDVVYPQEIQTTSVFITEGRFKAQQIAKEVGAIALSVQGVGNWRGVLKELKEIPQSPILKERISPILKERIPDIDKKFVINTILLAFDADMNYKVQVFDQAKKMSDSLEEHGFPVYYLNWDDALGKGIDDVMINGHKDAIKRYDKQIWDKRYEQMLKDLFDKELYTHIKDVPLEVVQKYFKLHFADLKPLGKNEISEKHRKMLAERKKKAV
jgi:DNA primase